MPGRSPYIRSEHWERWTHTGHKFGHVHIAIYYEYYFYSYIFLCKYFPFYFLLKYIWCTVVHHTKILQYCWLYSLWCTIYSCGISSIDGSLYLLIPSPISPNPPCFGPPATTCFLYLCLFLFWFFQIQHIIETIWYLSFSLTYFIYTLSVYPCCCKWHFSAFSFLPLNMVLAYMVFIMLRYVPYTPTCKILSNAFSLLKWSYDFLPSLY